MGYKTLQQITSTHDGKVSDKWAAYLNAYEEVLAEYQDATVKLLEIGVQNGGSLEIWEQYFSNLQTIVGCDINPSISQLEYQNPSINLVVGNATEDDTAKQILEHCNSFNIIIDDGSHRSDDIILTFARYFPVLELNGLFIIEDLHCSFWEEFQGGLFEPFSSLSFLKRLSDIINHEHWGIQKSRVEHLAKYGEKYGCEFDEEELKKIHSIEFINSMCIIRKKEADLNKLGKRIFSGQKELIAACSEEYAGTELISPDQSENYWSFQGTSLEDQLSNSLKEIEALKDSNETLNHKICDLENKILEYETSVSWKLTKPIRLFTSSKKAS
ncbi:class I SAM-dependent methyltransferase [Gimesia sp.]|uniref:class I SAM-dependent methyltransferase n=1 Tax=Gimesia sp. TaxID=2024833 RepID=UPI003A90CD6E